MNKIKIIALLIGFVTTTMCYGQRRPDQEKIKSLKIAFFTERLALSNEEAEVFWPAYNAHEAKISSFRKTEGAEFRKKLQNLEALSDEEASELLEKHIAVLKKRQEERQSFIEEMKKILSAKKTILLIKTEGDFKKRLIKQYRTKRQGGGERP